MEAEKVRDDSMTVSDDYRVAIPEQVREGPGLDPGDDVAWVFFDGTYRFVPLHRSLR